MMKTHISRLLLSALVLGFSATAVYAQKLPGEVRARIGLKDGKSPFGYIQNSRADAIQFSQQEGTQGRVVPFNTLKGSGLDLAIQIEGGTDILAPGRSAFGKGEFEKAAAEFAKVIKSYSTLAYIPRNFATEAAWYQLESLRRAGKYEDMAAVLETSAAKMIETKLDATYQKQFGFNKVWAIYGTGDMAALKTALEPYVIQPTSDIEKELQTKNYKLDIPEYELGQVAFLRAKVADAAGEKPRALQEYYRVFTLNFGSDPLLSKQSMLAALKIHKEMGELDNEKDKLPLQQIQGLAFQFKNTYGIGELSSDYAAYAVRPTLPHMLPFQPEEKMGSAKDEGKDDDKPAADKPKDDKPADAKKPAADKPKDEAAK